MRLMISLIKIRNSYRQTQRYYVIEKNNFSKGMQLW